MKVELTNIQIKDFLNDYKKNTEVYILEEASAKNELYEIAKARGIILKGSKDLIGFKCIYAFADTPNKNGAFLPEKELLKALPTMIGKPVNFLHKRTYIVGCLIDYRYIAKEKKVISYGVFYKSIFGKEYERAKKDFKNKKLNVSFEIWSPEEKRKKRRDGSFELCEMEIAGCALLFKETPPAFEDAKVLKFASLMDKNKGLVFASEKKYNVSEILTSDVTVEEKPKVIEINKIKCSNCEKEFESNGTDVNIKCPNCFAIVNQKGETIYPPQIKDFKLLCPSCRIGDWLILFNNEKTAKVKCLSCAKQYNLKFAEDSSIIREKFRTIYIGSTPCLQCGRTIPYSGVSNVREKILKCKSCGLEFNYNLDKMDRFKKILEIKEFDNTVKSSLEGGKQMDAIILTKFHRYADVEKFEDLEKAYIKDEYNKDFETSEKAKKLTTEERNKLSDKDFAVVVRVRNKKTSKMEKIRKYPIHDESHARNALSRLGQKPAQDELKKLGVSVEDVKTKVYKRLKTLQYKKASAATEKDKYYKTKYLRKALNKIKELKATLEKSSLEKELVLKNAIKKTAKNLIDEKKKVEFYKANAKEIYIRREKLDKFADELSDEDILNDDKFEKAEAQKELADSKGLETADDKVTDKRESKRLDKFDEFGKSVRNQPTYVTKK